MSQCNSIPINHIGMKITEASESKLPKRFWYDSQDGPKAFSTLRLSEEFRIFLGFFYSASVGLGIEDELDVGTVIGSAQTHYAQTWHQSSLSSVARYQPLQP